MAKTTKKPAAKKAAPKAAKKAAVSKAAAPKKAAPALKEVLGKSALVKHLAETSSVAAKDVKAVLAAIEDAVSGAISKKGAGSFTLPGLFKVTSVKVKVRPLKKLKDAAA